MSSCMCLSLLKIHGRFIVIAVSNSTLEKDLSQDIRSSVFLTSLGPNTHISLVYRQTWLKGCETSRGRTHKMLNFLLIILHVSKWTVELMKPGFLWMCILWLNSLVSSKMWVLIEVFPTVGAFIISHCLKAVSSSVTLSFRSSINGFSFCTWQPVFINPVKSSYLWDFYPHIKFN